MRRQLARTSLLELVPPGFECPICCMVRPAVSQWARANDGFAICRSCMRANPTLAMSPLVDDASPPERGISERRGPKASHERVGSVVCEAGLCFVCAREKTSRHCGYCESCARLSAFHHHGGQGSVRLDGGGVCMILTRLSGEPRAEYPWGGEAVPLTRTAYAERPTFFAQQRRMWEVAQELMSVAQRAAASTGFEDHERLFSEYGVKALCRACLRFEHRSSHSGSRDLSNLVWTSVYRDVVKNARREARDRSTCEVSLDALIAAGAAFEDARLSAADDRELAASRELDSLGLSQFELTILRLRFVDGLRLEDIGLKYGVVKSTVGGWLRRILRKCGVEQQ